MSSQIAPMSQKEFSHLATLVFFDDCKLDKKDENIFPENLAHLKIEGFSVSILNDLNQFRQGIALLANIKTLTSLDFSSTCLGPEHAKIIASAPFSHLKSLNLCDNQIKSDGAYYLAKSENLSGLDELNLQNNYLWTKGVRHIINSQYLNLRILNVAFNLIRDGGALEIAEAKSVKSLKSLNIEGNQLTNSDAKALLTTENFKNLETLYIGRNNISDLCPPSLPKLKTLGIQSNDLGYKGLLAFIQSDPFANLKEVDMSANRVSREEQEKLRKYISGRDGFNV